MGEIKPIRSEADYEAAVERLWGARSGTPEGDRLDVLATLIDAYESAHHPIDPPDPIEAIKFRMEQQGLTRKDLEGILGTRTRVAEVLNRRRGLSINMIRRLHDELGISARGADPPVSPGLKARPPEVYRWESERVGWVERRETHHLRPRTVGFAGAQPTLRTGSPAKRAEEPYRPVSNSHRA